MIITGMGQYSVLVYFHESLLEDSEGFQCVAVGAVDL